MEHLLKLAQLENTDIKIVRVKSGLSISRKGEFYTIEYSSLSELGYAFSLIRAGACKDGDCLQPRKKWEHLGYMHDFSRNGILNLTECKRLLNKLFLLGYDRFYMYMEDVYEVDGQPYFGHLRGRYSIDDLKEIDEYAGSLGIEIIPCIQTLAHLNGFIKWEETNCIVDTDDILLVGEGKTYRLIEDMISSLRKCFRTNTIHVGMDEAHMVGLGKYLDKHGYCDRTQIILSHIERVQAICAKYGFTPMIWSDMFFRLAFGGEYYSDGQLRQEVLEKIPKNLTLVYWDYYHTDKDSYVKMLQKHAQISDKVVFAGGAWRWMGFAPNNYFSMNASRRAIEAVTDCGADEVMVTGWGDDGAECSNYAHFPAIVLYAQACYGEFSEEKVATLFSSVMGCDMNDFMLLDLPNMLYDKIVDDRIFNPCKYLLYNDPLLGTFDTQVIQEKFAQYYVAAAEKLGEAEKRVGEFSYIFDTLKHLCLILEHKCDLGIRLRRAYISGDHAMLAEIADSLPRLIQLIDDFYYVFRKQWKRENKFFGFEVQDIRLGGLKQRLTDVKHMIAEYLAGDETALDELKEEKLRFYVNFNTEDNINLTANNWKKFVTPNIL